MYVLLIVDHHRRKIEHFAVTSSPSIGWINQQIRNATPFGKKPKYLIHDNDAKFRAKNFQQFLKNANIISKNTTFSVHGKMGFAKDLLAS